MAACVRSRENSLSREDSRCPRCGCFFLAGARQFFADGRKPQAALVQNLGGKALFFAQQTQQQMLGANVFVRKPFRLFRGIGQHALAFIAQGQIDRSRDLLPDRGVAFDLFADRFHRRMGAQETVGQGLIFAQQSEQQVLGLNIRRPELAGLVARKKDDAPGFLRIAFKHITLPPEIPAESLPHRQTLTLLHYAFISPNLPSDIPLP
jgi:hypothetical protein